MIFDLIAGMSMPSGGGGGGGGTFPVPGAPRLRERVSFRGSTPPSPLIVSNPGNIQIGDRLVFIVNFSVAGQISSFPSGWTRHTGASSSVRMQVFSKAADASDIAAANFQFAFTGGVGNLAWNFFVITNTTGATGVAGSQNSTAASLNSPTRTTTTPNNVNLSIFTDPTTIDTNASPGVQISQFSVGPGFPLQSVVYAEQATPGTTTAVVCNANPNFTNGTAYLLSVEG